MIRRLLAVLALLASAVLTTAAPASPVLSVPAHSIVDLATGRVVTMPMPMPPSMAPAPSGNICFYDYWSTGNVNYECDLATWVAGTSCESLGSSMRRRTSYIWNNSGAHFSVYTGATPTSIGCDGWEGPIYAHSDGNMGSPFNNSIVAVKFNCWCT